jgi:hypothetical protein
MSPFRLPCLRNLIISRKETKNFEAREIIRVMDHLSLHEVKTILTRAGENIKIIFTGDITRSILLAWIHKATTCLISSTKSNNTIFLRMSDWKRVSGRILLIWRMELL